jgi:hypothetical protein
LIKRHSAWRSAFFRFARYEAQTFYFWVPTYRALIENPRFLLRFSWPRAFVPSWAMSASYQNGAASFSAERSRPCAIAEHLLRLALRLSSQGSFLLGQRVPPLQNLRFSPFCGRLAVWRALLLDPQERPFTSRAQAHGERLRARLAKWRGPALVCKIRKTYARHAADRGTIRPSEAPAWRKNFLG